MKVVWQAGCVAIGERGVLIEGAPGSGKSSLALALIDRGAQLVGDDGVTLEPEFEGGLKNSHKVLWASPPPHTAGLMEVRNVGLVPFPVCERVRVALVLVLDPEAPRFIETAERCTRGGVGLPLVRLWPDSPVLALRAEAAVRLHS